MNKWISVEDKLPKWHSLLCCEYKTSEGLIDTILIVGIPLFNSSNKFIKWSYTGNSHPDLTPTHWMPLPNPPESE